MKTFVTLSAVLSAAVALPHHVAYGGHQHFAQPYGVPSYVPSAYHVQQPYYHALPYHSDAEANCRPEKEVFNVQSCVPSFEIVCKDKNVQQQTIKYEKKCTPVVSQICGNHHPVSLVMQEVDNGQVAEVEDTDLPVENKVYYLAPGVPMARHQCWDVPQEHCYLEPIVETQDAVVPACHVVAKPICTETSHEVSKVVCNKEEEVDANAHEHENGVVHTHEGGDEEHDHKEDAVVSHTHADETHEHAGGAIPHEHDDDHKHTHTHKDGTTHSHEHEEEDHEHEHEHTAEPKAAHVHAHAHADGTYHAHTHTPYHHASPYSMYYYYPQQNLYTQFGIYNVVNSNRY